MLSETGQTQKDQPRPMPLGEAPRGAEAEAERAQRGGGWGGAPVLQDGGAAGVDAGDGLSATGARVPLGCATRICDGKVQAVFLPPQGKPEGETEPEGRDEHGP